MTSEVTRNVIKFPVRLRWKLEYWWLVPLAMQLIALFWFSTFQYNRFALTHDFSLYWQAVWLIAHGHMDPYSSMDLFRFLDNHFELIMWPIGALYWIWPHASLLLYLQDVCLIGAEYVAWRWSSAILSSSTFQNHTWLRVSIMGALTLNPWVPWTAATDFHSESIAALTIIGAAYAVYQRKTSAILLWSSLSLACGDVSAVALAAVGMSAILTKRLTTGSFLIVLSVAWLALISALGANKGSILILIYGYLLPAHYHGAQMSTTLLVRSLVTRPGLALRELWKHRVNLYANAAPSGIIGVFSFWGLPMYLSTVLIANLSTGYLFGVPGFQNVIYYALGVVGTAHVLSWLWPHLRWPYLRKGLAMLLLANSILWSVVWIPQIPNHWVRVSRNSASALQSVYARIPRAAEVIAPQGLMGRFAGRRWLYNMGGHAVFRYPVKTSPTYIVMSPYEGVHFSSIQTQATWLDALAQNPRAKLIYYNNGVYLWKVDGSKVPVELPTKRDLLPAWPFQSTGSIQVISGPTKMWHLASKNKNGNAGNVLDRDYWREPVGRFTVSVTLSSWSSTIIQVWDVTSGNLLAQRKIPATDGKQSTYRTPMVYSQQGRPNIFSGWAAWRIQPDRALQNQLEVRVYSEQGRMVNVYRVGVQPSR